MTKVNVYLSDTHLIEMRRLAVQEGIPFAEMLRRVIGLGLASLRATQHPVGADQGGGPRHEENNLAFAVSQEVSHP
jgi:hypothetical protein